MSAPQSVDSAARVRELLSEAIEKQRAGDPIEAEILYRRVLAHEPGHADALHLLGVLAHHAGRHAEAAELIGRAVAGKPDYPVAHANRGGALLALGRPAEAAEAFGAALSGKPGYAHAMVGLADALLRQAKAELAESMARRALDLQPAHGEAANLLGQALEAQGRLPEAVDAYRAAVQAMEAHRPAWVSLARALAIAGQARDAAEAGRRAVALAPEAADGHLALGLALQAAGDAAAAAESLTRATELAPESAEAFNNLGAALQDLGRLDAAVEAFRRAVDLAPDSAAIAENLANAESALLPQWHFPMLADSARNGAYREAIERAVRPDDLVLDVGAGTGLLSMMAARAGAHGVVAVERLEPLAEAAREIVAANGYAERVRVLAKDAAALTIPEDLNRKVDLVISEILDAALLGEGVLPAMRAALPLMAEGARVIPAGATVFGMLVEMPRLKAVNPVREIEGFDLSAFDRFRARGAPRPVNLDREPHRALTAPVPLIAFDFAAPPPPEGAGDRIVPLAVTGAGRAQAVVTWFELALDDRTTVSTGPDGALRHWHQTVSFLDDSREVAPGERVGLSVTAHDLSIGYRLAELG